MYMLTYPNPNPKQREINMIVVCKTIKESKHIHFRVNASLAAPSVTQYYTVSYSNPINRHACCIRHLLAPRIA